MSELMEIMEDRAIVAIPKTTIEIDVVCWIDDDGNPQKVAKRLNVTDTMNAFIKAEDGFVPDEENAINPGEGMAFAMIEIPQGTCFANLYCHMPNKDTYAREEYVHPIVLGPIDVHRAVGLAEKWYIDEDDRFVITEKGMAMLKELLESQYE